jgi:hypothetical protein
LFSSPRSEHPLTTPEKGRPVAVKPEIVVTDLIIHKIGKKSIKIGQVFRGFATETQRHREGKGR